MDFAAPADHRVRLEESEKKEKYLKISRKLKKQRDKRLNMKVQFIPIVIGVFCTVTEGLERDRRTWK